MRVASVMFALLLFTAVGSHAQAAARRQAGGACDRQAGRARARQGCRLQAPGRGTLLQVMRGILFPNSNIIFWRRTTIRRKKPATPAEAKFGNPVRGWQNVENAAIALGEAANLLMIPGACAATASRPRSPDPTGRSSSRASATPRRSPIRPRSRRTWITSSTPPERVTEACSACHDKYREKPNLSLRCTRNKCQCHQCRQCHQCQRR